MNLKIKSSSFLNVFVHPIMGVSIHTWLKILFKQRFLIHPGYIPKVLFITMSALLGAPMQLSEFLVYSRRIKRQKVKNPVFIIGHPRSGTTRLFYLMSKDPQFAYCRAYEAVLPHVFLTGGRWLKGFIGRTMPDTRPQDNVKMTIDSPKEEEFAMANISGISYLFGFYFPRRAMRSFEESVTYTAGEAYRNSWKKQYSYFLKKLTYKYKGKQLLVKSPANTGRVKELLELYPDAKFIHIRRDPFEVYQSTKGLYEKIIQTTSFQSAKEDEVLDYIMDSYRLMYEKYFAEIQSLTTEQLVEVDYEALDKAPIETLKAVYEQLGMKGFKDAVPHVMEEIEDTHDYVKNTHVDITEEERSRINKEWGEVIRRLSDN